MKEYWTIKDKKNDTRVDMEAVSAFRFTKDRECWTRFESRVKALECQLTLQKCWLTSKSFVLVHHTKKPRGAKVGTWAWACEQMLAGQRVSLPGWGNRKCFAFVEIAGDFQLCSQRYGSRYIPESPRMSDFQATGWQVVPSTWVAS